MADAQVVGNYLVVDASGSTVQVSGSYLIVDASGTTARVESVYLIVDAIYAPPAANVPAAMMHYKRLRQ